MRWPAYALTLLLACGGTEPAPPVAATAPLASPAKPAVAVPLAPACDRSAAWRYALVGAAFEPTQDVSLARLTSLWKAGDIAASTATARALDPVLGRRAPGAPVDVPAALAPGRFAIVPAHELQPQWAVVTVGGAHPLGNGPGALVAATCGATAPNIDPDRLTSLVMSGTTAMTGRTAERIDTHGVADIVTFIKPFFASADVVHVSNEVSFVKNCKPRTGQEGPFVFCARDRYVDLLEALHVTVIELTGSHLLDYGNRSLLRTIEMYEQRGLRWYGGGRTQNEATAPVVVEHHGNKLAFVGCNAVNWWIKAISQGPGTANCDWPRMVWQIQDLRRRGFTPIATVQHRELRVHTPPPDLVRDLRKLAEAGAVFVEGSQAHVAHPWDVHHGGFVHYGPGNILFAQYRDLQRDATVDKLYIYEGRLLTVSHIFTRTEHGQPRLLDERERTRFLRDLAAAAGAIAPPDPAAAVALPPVDRMRPDSVVIAGRVQKLSITVPATIAADRTYPLVVDLALTRVADPDAFVVVRTGRAFATGTQIAQYMRSQYPIDAERVTITPAPEDVIPRRVKRKRSSRYAAR